MIYSLLVLSSPCSGQGSATAVQFAQAVIDRGHQIRRIFFLDDGTLAGAASTVTPQDETNTVEQWASFGTAHNVELFLCVSSALKRGLLDTAEAQRYEKNAATVHRAFEIAGLGQLIDATFTSDRMITFGG
jgi:tRNA 2-thiouridine synthesizing protein D